MPTATTSALQSWDSILSIARTAVMICSICSLTSRPCRLLESAICAAPVTQHIGVRMSCAKAASRASCCACRLTYTFMSITPLWFYIMGDFAELCQKYYACIAQLLHNIHIFDHNPL